MGDESGVVGVIQQVFSCPCQKCIVLNRRVAKVPGLARCGPMRAHQRTETTELEPPHIDSGLRKTKIPAKVTTPVRITACTQVQRSGHNMPKPTKVGRMITSKLANPPLRSRCSPSCIKDEVVSAFLLEYSAYRS